MAGRAPHRRDRADGRDTVPRPDRRDRRGLAAGAAALVFTMAALVVVTGPTPATVADSAPVNPADPATPATVTADALPTTQIDGVAWTQVVAGDRVFVGGRFTSARPAGSPAGVGETPRSNLLAYRLSTGVLDPTFAPALDAQVRALALSPDGTRLYVGGDFTTIDGQPRQRIAAFDLTTGALVATFAPNIGYHVHAIVVTDDRVYVGGNFQGVGTQARAGLAAFRSSDGALLDWAPAATGGMVTSMVISPDRSELVVGGRFTALNGSTSPGYGLGAVDAITGALLPFAANELVRNAGDNAGVTSLTSDGTFVYGSSFVFGKSGNHEGVFKARWDDGTIDWIQDCHGDTYGVHVQGGVVYTVGHAHYCGNIGGFSQNNPWTFNRAIAFSTAAVGTATREPYGYTDFSGRPTPALLNWFPQVELGSFTGQWQGPWTVSGDGRYVVLGGEFPSVNGTPQQGLVRFAVPSIAPKRQVARLFLDGWPLRLTSLVAGEVRLTWSQNWDRDNATLVYRVFREGVAAPIHEITSTSRFWNLQTMTTVDTGLVPGATHRYRVVAIDPWGNQAPSNWTTVTVATTTTSPFLHATLATAPVDHWRLGEGAATTGAGADAVGTRPLAYASPTLGEPGAIVGDADTAAGFRGDRSSHAGSASLRPAPATDFSIAAWFRTTTAQGGKIVGYGVNQLGDSARTDRHVYMSDDGRLHFGVDVVDGLRTISSTGRYADGVWHHVVASLGADGMRLYVDGSLVAVRTDVTRAAEYAGHWRIGGDNLAGWPSRPSSDYFAGTIDEVSVYHRVLDPATVAALRAAGGSVVAPNQPPVASFTSTVDGLAVVLDATRSSDVDGTIAGVTWDLGDGRTATGATVSTTYAAAGTYRVTATVTDDDGATTAATADVVVSSTPAPFAVDGFERSVVGGLGTADVGGAWTVTGPAGDDGVSAGVGRLVLPTPGSGRNAALSSATSASADVRVRLGFEKPATGNGTYVSLLGRRVGTADYRAKVRLMANGSVQLFLGTMQGSETTLASATATGLTLTPADRLVVRMQVTGTAPTTIRAKIWKVGDAEPVAWTLTATDATPALQAPGHIGLALSLSGSATNAPAAVLVDDLSASPAV